MSTKTFLKFGQDYLPLSEADAWQRRNCDRYIVDKGFNILRVITHEELRALDFEIKTIPIEPLLVSSVVPIFRRLRAREEVHNELELLDSLEDADLDRLI